MKTNIRTARNLFNKGESVIEGYNVIRNITISLSDEGEVCILDGYNIDNSVNSLDAVHIGAKNRKTWKAELDPTKEYKADLLLHKYDRERFSRGFYHYNPSWVNLDMIAGLKLLSLEGQPLRDEFSSDDYLYMK